jgi:hypothetical protein
MRDGGCMNFSELSASEKAALTYKELKRRKELKAQGDKQALDHLFENTYRIQKARKDIKRSRPVW